MPFSLTDFSEVFDLRDDSGLPHILIGGQAVNYWAETYLPQVPELAQFFPFVSKDIDFLGGRGDVLNAARKLGLEPRFPHKKLMTAFAGAVLLKIAGDAANLEFVRKVPGVSEAEIRKWAVTSRNGEKVIRILDPISMLTCKLTLTLTVDQTERRDGVHVRILLLCVRAFLRETLHGVETGDLPARGWLGATERVLKLAESATGGKAARQLGVNWPEALPQTEISASPHPVAVQFREQRLPQWLAKMGRRKRVKRP